MTQRKLIHVAAAVIRNGDGAILIAQRAQHQHQGGLWEFPGGKVEAGEAVEQALARELHEELGIDVEQARPLIRIPHHYPDKSVLLDVWCVDRFSGEPHGREGQPVRWVSPTALDDFAFPAANRPIVTAAQLPERLLITGAAQDPADYLSRTEAALQQGIRWVMLRAPEQDEATLAQLYRALQPLCARYGAVLVLNASVALANQLGAQALHLNRHRLAELQQRSDFKGRWLSASCHDADELARAQALALDFVTLSPVAPTASHPGAETLGWRAFAALAEDCTLPVFALGGVGEADLASAWHAGAQGVAAISAWWPSAKPGAEPEPRPVTGRPAAC